MQLSYPSIVEAMKRHALDDPNKPAFIFVNETLDHLVLTRQQVWDYSRKFAALLRKTGLERGDVICNTLPNSPQRLLSMLGSMTAGCITMSAQSCMADGSDLLSSLNRGQANGIILNPSDQIGTLSILRPLFQKYDPVNGEVSCQDVPTLKYVLPCTLGNWGNFFQRLEEYEKDMMHVDIDSNDICAYMSTSGSSGVVKLVPFSSNVLFECADVLNRDVRDKVYMCDLDLGWITGFPHSYLSLGMTRVLVDRGSNIPDDSIELQWKMAVQEKCQICFTAPLNLIEYASVRRNSMDDVMRNYRFERLISGGGPITRKHVQAAIGEITKEIMIVYGSTEGCIMSNSVVKSMDEYEDFNTGYPTRNTEVKVVDTYDKEVPSGELGEIIFRTQMSLRQYVNDIGNSSKTFDKNGWIRLDDVGKVNDKGQLYVMGRNKFAILKGNIVFYPEVIERFIRSCPGVKDVAIVGVSDDKLFQEICAFIIKQSNTHISEKDIKSFLESMIINDDSMIPKYVFFVDSFPLTKREKLDRVELKKMANKILKI